MKDKITNKKDTSVFISLILRHKPEVIEESLDEYGFIEVSKLIEGANKKGYELNMNILEEIVAEDTKGRYSFNEDKTMIRANQGHSVKVNLNLKEVTPPSILYHGTGENYVESIMDKGIDKRKRHDVHLSDNLETALSVGKRHGKPVVLEIDTVRMVGDGVKFYLSDNGVYLTKYVHPKYIL